jgi:hypothetical protein
MLSTTAEHPLSTQRDTSCDKGYKYFLRVGTKFAQANDFVKTQISQIPTILTKNMTAWNQPTSVSTTIPAKDTN